jgi:cyclic pyranopterin phosphate synthase
MPLPLDKLGRELRDLRISVIDACNLRCTYCMPEGEGQKLYQFMKRRELLTADEIIRLTKLFVQLGVVKVRLTGGEPLMRKDLPEIIAGIAALPEIEDIALTTNDYWLAEQAQALRDAGLHRLTVSLDTLRADRAKDMTGRDMDPQRIVDGIKVATDVGMRGLKVNVVVMKGRNDDEILSMAKAFRGTGQVIRFIEYMDVGTRNNWESEHVIAGSTIVDQINAVYPLEPVAPRWRGEVAKRFRYVDGQGEVGMITSVSSPFCRSCNRARLTADGKLFSCLFGTSGFSFRDLLRNGSDDTQLVAKIRHIWTARDDRYSEIRQETRNDPAHKPVEMNHIGG